MFFAFLATFNVRPVFTAVAATQRKQEEDKWGTTETIKYRIQDPNPPTVLLYRTMNKAELCNSRLRKGFKYDFNRLHPHIEIVVTLVVAFFGRAVEVDPPNVQGNAKKGDNAANDGESKQGAVH